MPLSETATATNPSRMPTIAANAAFVPIGIVTVLLGPMLPTLSARWSLNYGQAGSLFTAQFVASTCAVSLSGWLVARLGFRFAINAGLLAMAIAMAMLPFTSYLPGVACIVLYGTGLGLAVPACNLLVSEVNPTRRSAALNTLNFSWSIGAVACPFLVAAAARTQHIPLFLIAESAFLLIVLLGISTMPRHAVEPPITADEQNSYSPIRWRSSAFLVLVSLFFLYVGAENSFGGWSATYAKSLPSFTPARAVMTPSFFYSAVMLGRWLAPFLLRTVDEVKLARAGITATCAGMAALQFSHSMLAVEASVCLAGLGCSAIYPITIALLAHEFGPAAKRLGSIMFTVANLGGATMPWLVGQVSYRFGSLRVGLTVPLIASILMYALYSLQWGKYSARTPA